MRLPSRRRRGVQEPVVPLINVVFLLLVFFLLTGTLRAPEALDVEPPRRSEGAKRSGDDAPAATLWLDERGRLSSGDGPLALAELRTWWHTLGGEQGSLELRADAAVTARALLPLLEELEAAGVPEVVLATRPLR